MDLKLHRPRGSCAVTGRAFTPGESFYSTLVRAPGGLDRLDVASDAWTGPPDRALAWWRSAYPAADSSAPELAPVDVLLDVLEETEGRADDAALRYLLALQLVRRRVLRIADDAGGPTAAGTLVLACRKRDRDYRVQVVPAVVAQAPGVEQRLTALLWSGGAA
jgi:hypothetical protein